MREVTVDKSHLLDTVRANRENHRAEFERAIEAWQRTVVAELEKAVEDAKHRRAFRTYFQLPMPQDHTEDYDDVIGMLELELNNEVKLSIQEYRRFVTDDWEWKAGFTETASQYLDKP